MFYVSCSKVHKVRPYFTSLRIRRSAIGFALHELTNDRTPNGLIQGYYISSVATNQVTNECVVQKLATII